MAERFGIAPWHQPIRVPPFLQYQPSRILDDILAQLGLLIRLERGCSASSRRMPPPSAVHALRAGAGEHLSLRLLLARAIVTRPHVLIVDGTLHSVVPSVRAVILRRLCSKDEPWSVVFVSNDPTFTSHVDRRVTLE